MDEELNAAKQRLLDTNREYEERYEGDGQEVVEGFLNRLAQREEMQSDLLRELVDESKFESVEFTGVWQHFLAMSGLLVAKHNQVGASALVSMVKSVTGLKLEPLPTSTAQASPMDVVHGHVSRQHKNSLAHQMSRLRNVANQDPGRVTRIADAA